MSIAAALRRDAELNRQRLLTAGREVLAQRGLDATLHDVAQHAGVGVGTAYRRFPNKQALVDAIFEVQVSEVEQILHQVLELDDAWLAVVEFLEQSLAIQCRDRALAQIFSGQRLRQEQNDWQRDRLAPLIDELAAKARKQKVVRPEVTGTDLVFIQIGIAAIAGSVRDGFPVSGVEELDQLYRRYLWVMLDGIRHTSEDRRPWPVRALTRSETHSLLTQQ